MCKDMDRAVAFYEGFFERPVTEKDIIYSVFDINGFRMGLFADEKMQEKHTYGSNCLPSIRVANVDILRHKLETLKVIFPLKTIGENWVSEFEDSEGNHTALVFLYSFGQNKTENVGKAFHM